MNKIRVAMMAVALVAGVSSVSIAQDGGQRQGGRGGRGVTMLLQGITVEASLQAKIDSVVAKYAAESRGIMQQGTPPDSTTRAKMMEISAKRNADIRALLPTDADKAKFDENVKNMPQGRRGGGGR